MRFSLSTISMCVLATAASVFAMPSAKVAPIDNATVASLNDNTFVQVYPEFAINTPDEAVKRVMEPDVARPNTVTFYSAYDKCIRWAKVERSSILKRIKKITFYSCDNDAFLAEVKLSRNLLGAVNNIKIKMPRDREEEISISHTLIKGNVKEMKVERNWVKNYVTKVEIDHNIWGDVKEVVVKQKTLA
ncbi:hypothetical protein BDF19DRAFT_420135 [Syncephalis fuscata]|nr:hypothetical protein BDF19DRAFT_420135 [Syncephalis fuscata]